MGEAIGSVMAMTSAPKAEVEKRRLKASCEEFESFLTGNLLKTMRDSTIRAEEPDNEQEVYESMLDQTIAKEISHSKSLGLGEMLYRELSPSIKADSGNS